MDTTVYDKIENNLKQLFKYRKNPLNIRQTLDIYYKKFGDNDWPEHIKVIALNLVSEGYLKLDTMWRLERVRKTKKST